MASSFLEDLLEKEVDEKEVSAMVGSLESQLASTAIPRSHHNEVKASVAASKASPKLSNMTSKAPNQTSPIQNQTVSAVRPGISSSPVLNAGGNTTITTVVNIAPRPTVTTAVPLAPRPATMAVLAPNSGFTGAPRFVTTMINADLVNRTNLSLINPQQITLAPRVVTGNVTVPGNPQAITTPQIIQQIQPRAANIGNMRSINPTQIVLQQATGSTPIQPDKKINIIQTQIRPVPASVSVSQNVPIRTSLTPIRPQITSMPGTVTYRMPVNQVAVAPSKTAISSAAGTVLKTTNTTNATNAGIHVSKTVVTNNVAAAKQSTPPQTIPSPSVTHPQPQIRAQLEQIKEQAHKLNNFFSNLVRLASDQKSPDVGKTVKELVSGVMDGKLTEEQFAANLQTTLNSPPQPNLVGFLKKTLPMLRAQRSQSSAALLSHVQQSSTPQKILPQQQVQQKNTTATLANSPQIHKHNSQVQKIQIVQQPTQPGQPPILKQVILTPAQQELFRRQQQINSQRVYLTTSTSATPGSQVVTSSRNVVMVHAPPGSTAAKMAVASARSQAGTSSASTAADKLKPKGFTGISSSGDDDINDVTSMAGVNLMEESQRILAINSDLLSSQTRSCKEEPFLNVTPFQKRLEALARKHGLSEVSQEVFNLVSHATQERLRNILEKLSTISLHRLEVYRDDPMYEVGLDIRSQLRVFEQIDEVERKKRDARERDILMRAVRSRSRQEDPEQARLKEKAKQLQQEEEEVIRKRAANSTALAAIGPRKKRKLDEALEGSSTSTAGSSSSSSSPLSSTALGNKKDSRQQVPRQRMRRVLLKDLIFVMEQEKETTKSLLLYKALLK